MNTLFIVNPIAGRNKSQKIWDSIKTYINFPFEYTFTKSPEDATEIATHARMKGYTRVVAVGGDGTVNEVVNGIIGSNIELGIIPTGTGNDFVKTLEIPQMPIEALTIIEKGHNIATVDIGKHKRGYFVNVAGVGFDAEVVSTTNTDLKFLTGPLAYITSVIWNLIRYGPRDACIEIDGVVLQRKLWLVAVANGRYFGGGMMISPDSAVNDGLFDICMVNAMSRLEILRFLPKVFHGKHKNHRAFEVLKGKYVKIKFHTPTMVQADGKILGHGPIDFTMVPKALKVIRG